MNKHALLSILFLVLCSFLATAVYADSAAYVVRNPSYPDVNIVNALTSGGFTVTLIDDDNAASTNFSQYDLLVVGDEIFTDPSAIPVKDHRSVVANTYYVEDWGWANGVASMTVGNNYLKGKIVTNNSITIGLPNPVQLYNAYNIQGYMLPRLPDRSRDAKNIVSTTTVDMYPFIATLEPGARLYGSGYATQRSCWYGLVNSDYWTTDARTLFVRCARFAMSGLDKDNDGYPVENDCNDTNPNINPAATEIPYNHIDENCNGYDLADVDADGYCKLGYQIQNKTLQCPLETGTTGTDCNDNNASIHPNTADISYNNIDENCDGYDLADVDQDGYCKLGYTIENKTLQCSLETGATGTDCNDANQNIHPGAAEILHNGIDENCDGLDFSIVDVDQDGYCIKGYAIQNKTFECLKEAALTGTDCNDNNSAINSNATEIPYNGIDDNCQGYDLADVDQDGYCKLGYQIQNKTLQCPLETGSTGTDCNDNNANIHPLATEIPYNGIDENCKGYDLADVDADGYCKLGYQIQNKTLQCPLETGATGTDCNDNDSSIHPNAQEIPYDSIDQNCDGKDIADVDADGYCNQGYTIQNKTVQCAMETGATGTDCNDTNTNVNPGKKEIYHNGIDDDCNAGTVDNDWTPPGHPVNLRAKYANGNIVLTWNAPAGEPVEVYKIYTAFSPQSFDFNSPYLNTSALGWTDTLATSKQQKYYVVRAQDSAGNLENNTYKVGKFDIPLQQGYNLVSSPLVFFNSTISEVLQAQPVSEIVRYSSGFQTAVNNGGWHSDSGFTELQINKGYFFKVQSGYNLTLTGTVTEEQQNVALQQGLNLVGYTRLSSSGFDIFSQYPGNYSIQEVSQFVNHNYQAATYYPTIHWYSPENFNQLVPGRGYWLKLNRATTWSYSSK